MRRADKPAARPAVQGARDTGAVSLEAVYAVGLEALQAGEAGDLDAAAVRLRGALEESPADAALARLLCRVLAASGERREALAVLERAAKRSPKDADLLIDLGYARLAADQTDQALHAFQRALPLRPQDALIRQPMARIHEMRGEASLAAKALAGVPQQTASPRLLGDLARLYLGLGRHRQAEAVFRALEVVDPEHVLLARHGSTWCLIKQGNWRLALEASLEATRLDRFGMTTALLAYAKDRLFTRVPDAERREAELGERLLAELREHDELHAEDEEAGLGGAGPRAEESLG
jgi:tetratricopeptide (TPR) repeat protein